MRTPARILAVSLACAALAPGRADASAPTDARGFDRARPYLAVSPGGVIVPLNRERILPTAYVWGIEGGYHFAFGRFKVQPGALFEHSVYRETWSTAHWLRLGPQVRVGGGGRRLFGYGSLGLQLDILRSTGGGHGDTWLMAHPTAGAGIQGSIRDRLLIGGEAAVDAVGDLALYLRLSAFLGVLF
jgi:hypothetical protein